MIRPVKITSISLMKLSEIVDLLVWFTLKIYFQHIIVITVSNLLRDMHTIMVVSSEVTLTCAFDV
jgi:hypothetical protein